MRLCLNVLSMSNAHLYYKNNLCHVIFKSGHQHNFPVTACRVCVTAQGVCHCSGCVTAQGVSLLRVCVTAQGVCHCSGCVSLLRVSICGGFSDPPQYSLFSVSSCFDDTEHSSALHVATKRLAQAGDCTVHCRVRAECTYGYLQTYLMYLMLIKRSNLMQQYADIYLLQSHSTCFGCHSTHHQEH